MRTLIKVTAGLFLATSLSPIASAHDTLINNGHLSTSPKSGYLYSCQTSFNGGGASAETNAWRDDTTYSSSDKPTVSGSVNWPSEISITLNGNKRVVHTNSLPDHPTGIFPVASSDDAYKYDRNPNSIQARDIILELPANPTIASSPTCISLGAIGFATSGAVFYNALDAIGRDAPAYEIMDDCGGHPQRSGQYHYHDSNTCLTDTQSQANGHSDLVGYALDGFGIFGTHGVNGAVITNADLDTCHGHTHTIEWNGKDQEIYHYHLSAEFPYTLGCYAGTPVSAGSAANGSGDGNNSASRPQRGPGQGGDRLASAAAKLGVSVAALRDAVGAPPPDFSRAAKMLGIPAADIRAALGAPGR